MKKTVSKQWEEELEPVDIEMVEEDGEETQEEQKMEKKKGKSRFICQGVFSYAKKRGGGRERERGSWTQSV